ncbi:MAG: hypothetical protein PHR35_10890, partial [Kiritimatiellae bacterium]|nr:hypothetical protein [Kiritimatiellia bacterium]
MEISMTIHIAQQPSARKIASRWLATTAMVAVAATKWSLIWPHEIVSQANDSHNYVALANNLRLFNKVLPGYPFWLWLTRHTGIPQRLMIEALWLA